MINNSPFDDHIKKRFDKYEPEVPSHVWENVMAGKEKRRPAGFLFSLAGNRLLSILVIVALSAGGALLIHTINKNNSNKINLPLGESAATSTNTNKKDQNNNTLNSSNTSISDEPTSNTNSGTANQENNIGERINSNTNTTVVVPAAGENNLAGAVQPKENRTIAAINKNDNTDKDLSKASSGQPTTKKNKTRLVPTTADSNDNPEITGQLTAKNRKSNRSNSKSKITTSNPGTETTDENNIATKSTAAVANNNKAILLENYYLNVSNTQPAKTFSFSVKSPGLSGLNIPCPSGEKNTAGNKRYFEIYGGPDYVFRTFNDTGNSAYLKKRKESTSFSSAFSFGMRYTKVFNNAMSFRTGINYSQVNERFKYEQGHLVQMVHIIDNNGDTTGSYATTGTRYKTTHNKYRTLDIPLILGYEMGNGRLHTNINAGLVVNVYSWQKGDVLDNAYQPVNITTGKTSSPYQFKTNIGIGFMGGVSFYYKLTGRLHVLAEPYIRYNLSAANKSEITLKQKYTTAGLRLGLRIDF